MLFPLAGHRKAKLSHVSDVFFDDAINKTFAIRIRILKVEQMLLENGVQGINFFFRFLSHDAVKDFGKMGVKLESKENKSDSVIAKCGVRGI